MAESMGQFPASTGQTIPAVLWLSGLSSQDPPAAAEVASGSPDPCDPVPCKTRRAIRPNAS